MNLQRNYTDNREAFSISQESSNLLGITRKDWRDSWDQYFYHGDHLGSSAWITDANGEANQYLAYMPFGEALGDQRATGHDIRFKFTGKERDAETGFDYFGARFPIAIGSSDLSVWLSVDPLADKYMSNSPYMYVLGNPILLTDPDGRWVKGAGFWRNITKSDNRINAEYKAASLGGDATAYKNPDGKGWNVSYSSKEEWPADLENGGTTLSSLRILNFDKSAKKKREHSGQDYLSHDDFTLLSHNKPDYKVPFEIAFAGTLSGFNPASKGVDGAYLALKLLWNNKVYSDVLHEALSKYESNGEDKGVYIESSITPMMYSASMTVKFISAKSGKVLATTEIFGI